MCYNTTRTTIKTNVSMIVNRAMIINLIFLYFLCFVSLSIADDKVKYVAVIFRHGDRTPVSLYPKDPWRNESLWPVKFGELTNVGKRQHFALGQWLRKRYSDLLSNEFDPSELYVRSTDVDRTLMSAQANLAGLYPPSGNAVWDPDLKWQPIPVHTVPELEDAVLAMKKKCNAYNSEMERYTHSKPYINRLSKYQELMDYLTAHTGEQIMDYAHIGFVYSNLYIETLYNFTLPDWTQSVYPDKLREPAGYSFAISAATPLLARLRAGPLIKEIVSNMVQSMANETQLKFSMYSGHDYTIGTVLTALGIFDGNCPEYTSTIIMELIHDDTANASFIKISYRNSPRIVEPHVMTIPYCGQKCPIEKFIKLYDNLLTVDFEKECVSQFTSPFGISFLIGLCIFATIYIALKVQFARVVLQRGFNVTYSNVQTVKLESECGGSETKESIVLV